MSLLIGLNDQVGVNIKRYQLNSELLEAILLEKRLCFKFRSKIYGTEAAIFPIIHKEMVDVLAQTKDRTSSICSCF